MTISLLSIDNFYNNLMFCESLGLKVNCNLAFGQEWTKKELLIFKEELKKIITYYLSKKRFLSLLPFCNLLDIN
jgi:hypothetical protein